MNLIRVEYRRKREFVPFELPLVYENFIKNVAETFGITQKNSEVFFYDQYNTPIRTVNVLEWAFQKYESDASFLIKIEFRPKQTDEIETLITSETLEKYLVENGWQQFFETYDEGEQISISQRKDLMNKVADMIIDFFGYYPDQNEKVMISKAIVSLFPCLAMNPSECGGIDAIFNPSTSTGWLVSILKTRRTQNHQTKPKKKEQKAAPDLDNEYSSIEADADILFLKQTPYNNDTKEEIKLKLKRTASLRQLLLTDPNANMLANFPYLFVHHDLILFAFPLVCESGDPNGFLNKWPAFSTQLPEALQLLNKKTVLTKWNKDVKTILMLLRLLPMPPKRKNKDKKVPSAATGDCLFVFAKEGTPKLNAIDKSKIHPYIVGLGKATNQISEYFIVIEHQIIEIQDKPNFWMAFDLFFKAHYVLNLVYEPNIENIMNFFGHFFYAIKGSPAPTPTMVEIYNKIAS